MIDASDVQIRKAPQQDFGLRAYATADLQESCGTAVVDMVKQRIFEHACLAHQPRLLLCGEAVDVRKIASSDAVHAEASAIVFTLLPRPVTEMSMAISANQ